MAQISISPKDRAVHSRFRWLPPLARQFIFYVLFLVFWYVLANSGIWKSYLLSGPLDVGVTLLQNAQDGTLFTAISVSLRRLAVGYAISLGLGLFLGLAIGLNRYIEETLGSLVLGLQALPSVCWTPFALLWFGLNEQAMIFVVIMGALFSITLGVDAGVKNTPPVYLKAARNMGARGINMATQVVLPAALPTVLSGLKQGWSFAWRSLMAAELIYITPSLGGLLQTGRDLQDMPLMIAVMLVIIVLGVTIDALIFSPLERVVRRRWGLVR